jgi:hypothetical protein
MSGSLRKSSSPKDELLIFARACPWLEQEELLEIEALAPYMLDDECLAVLGSLQIETQLRISSQEV